MKSFEKFGVASKQYTSSKNAADDTYTDLFGNLISTPLVFPDNPFTTDVLNAKVVFEIGTGVGRNIEWIMENTSAKYYGVDPNESMTKYVWDCNDEKYKNRVYVSNTFDDVISNIKIDVVISTFVFQHIGYMTPDNIKNVSDITTDIRKLTNNGCVWILLEHDGEDKWIDRWFNDQKIVPDVYIRTFKNIESMTHRDHCAPGGHHLIIWKESKSTTPTLKG